MFDKPNLAHRHPRRFSAGILLLAVTLLIILGLLATANLPAARAARQDAPAAVGTFANTAPIVIADGDANGPGSANPYPSTITVAGLSGTITDVNVTLSGLTHTWPDDIALLLVGPSGQALVIQSDVGTGNDVAGITYTLDDQATSIMPDSGTLTAGTFRPTSVLNDEIFPTYTGSPAAPTTFSQSSPAGSATLNGTFGSTTANGVWRLYAVDAFTGDTGTYSGGWSLTITTNGAVTDPQTPEAAAPQAVKVSQEKAVNGAVTPDAPASAFTNNNAITITDATAYEVGSANPYPSALTVAGLSGTVTDVNVTINGLTHPAPDDIGMMLVGPAGQHIILQSDVGGSVAVSNVTYTFDDQAVSGLPNAGTLTAGTFRPTSVGDDERFPSGAAAAPYRQPAPAGTSTLNSIFAGTTPNGTWQLFVVDSFNGDSGRIANGWTLELTTSTAVANVQFNATAFGASEGDGSATITVTRTGTTSGAGTVDYATADATGKQRLDYTASFGTLSFAAGETTKTFAIPLTDNVYVDGSRTVQVALSNATGTNLAASPSTAVLTITDNDTATPTTNPAETASFFVRQQYHDFLNRVPDSGGLTYWTQQITDCGTDAACIRRQRVAVSNAFFYEQEFQQTGAFVYRLYRAAYGNSQPFPNPNSDSGTPIVAANIPSYEKFSQDRARVVGSSDLAASLLALANTFVTRAEFTQRYATTLTNTEFVDAVLANIQTASSVSLTSQRTALINLANASGRGAVLYRLADDSAGNPIANSAFLDAEYNRGFVLTQYFGYLRRDPDIAGLNFWFNVVSRFTLRDAAGQKGMVCAFITSTEYQQRFSSVAPRSNSECQ